MELHSELYNTCFYEHMKDLIEKYPFDAQEVIRTKETEIINEIRDIVADEKIEDFELAEKIVCIFEKYGIDCGSRHDFG